MKGRFQPETVPVEQAVGHVIAHDLTEIRPGKFKGPAFRKGHVVREEDIEHLKRIGKRHLYVLRLRPGDVHEDEAALRLVSALAGPGITYADRPREGKVALRAAHRGLLSIDVEALVELCRIPVVCCASRHTRTVVDQGTVVAAARVIPLVIDDDTLSAAERIARARGHVFEVKPFTRPRVGVVVTGSETHEHMVDDAFVPVLGDKLAAFGCDIARSVLVPADRQVIADSVRNQLAAGCGLILVTGGMSVDPDDVSRAAILEAGATDVVYGTPVLPGAMFLSGRIGEVPVLGLPACVIHHPVTVFDLLLPRVLAGEVITRDDLARLAHGGLCLECGTCRFPDCPFGKG